MPATKIHVGDCLDSLRAMPDASVQTCVTSPPYYGLRDYGEDGQIGLEDTPAEYVARLVAVFEEVRRVLRDDGTLWLNLGDSYASSPRGNTKPGGGNLTNSNIGSPVEDARWNGARNGMDKSKLPGLKPKDLLGIPWRVAFALQDAGWYLRSEIIWAKGNPMPESVTDRPTRSHETVFLLSKSARYFYDHEAVKEDSANPEASAKRYESSFGGAKNEHLLATNQVHTRPIGMREFDGKRNRRSVWQINTRPFSGAHFAVFPPDLVEPCILAGTSAKGCCAECGAPWERVVEKDGAWYTGIDTPKAASLAEARGGRGATSGLAQAGWRNANLPTTQTTGWAPTCDCNASAIPCTVLDPFGGAGTTALVAMGHGRDAVLCELNPEYADVARARLTEAAPMFDTVDVIHPTRNAA